MKSEEIYVNVGAFGQLFELLTTQRLETVEEVKCGNKVSQSHHMVPTLAHQCLPNEGLIFYLYDVFAPPTQPELLVRGIFILSLQTCQIVCEYNKLGVLSCNLVGVNEFFTHGRV